MFADASAVVAEARDADSDFEAAERLNVGRYGHRGDLHAARMREAKARKGGVIRATKAAKFKLSIVNRWRTRRLQEITLQTREVRDPRSGAHKKWTPEAVLSVMFRPRLPKDALEIMSLRVSAVRRRIRKQEEAQPRRHAHHRHAGLQRRE